MGKENKENIKIINQRKKFERLNSNDNARNAIISNNIEKSAKLKRLTTYKRFGLLRTKQGEHLEYLKKSNRRARFKNKYNLKKEKLRYRAERTELIEINILRLSKSMVIVVALIFFMISSSLLNARVEEKTTNIPNVNEEYQYSYKYVNLDDLDNIGNLIIETPRKLFISISYFVSSLSGLFSMENGSIVLLDKVSTFVTSLSYDIEKVVNFLSGNVFKPVLDWLEKLFNK